MCPYTLSNVRYYVDFLYLKQKGNPFSGGI